MVLFKKIKPEGQYCSNFCSYLKTDIDSPSKVCLGFRQGFTSSYVYLRSKDSQAIRCQACLNYNQALNAGVTVMLTGLFFLSLVAFIVAML